MTTAAEPLSLARSPRTDHQAPSPKPKNRVLRSFLRHWDKYLSVSGAIGAVVISLVSLEFTYNSAADTGSQETIKHLYDTYFEWTKVQLQAPETMHLFVLPSEYNKISDEVRRSVAGKYNDIKAQMRIKERSVADYIFTMYEYTLYAHQVSEKFGDGDRAKLENDVVAYFDYQLLRNPRLVYFWRKDGGNLQAEYQPQTREHYERYVLWGLDADPDPVGPLADAPVKWMVD